MLLLTPGLLCFRRSGCRNRRCDDCRCSESCQRKHRLSQCPTGRPFVRILQRGLAHLVARNVRRSENCQVPVPDLMTWRYGVDRPPCKLFKSVLVAKYHEWIKPYIRKNLSCLLPIFATLCLCHLSPVSASMTFVESGRNISRCLQESSIPSLRVFTHCSSRPSLNLCLWDL